MPLPFISDVIHYGWNAAPHLREIVRYGSYAGGLLLVRRYCGGAKNVNERVLHSKVAIMTGGTSGLGYMTAYELASRGCQLILLVRSTKDQFVIDTIEDLRERTGNPLIYAEECDLNSLHSVRLFATKWIDNSPPRRLDMVICCAGVMAPPFKARETTQDGVEQHWGINYLAHFHLLNILTPAIKAQPAGRDVRIILTTCGSYMMGELSLEDPQFFQRGYPIRQPWKCYGASKLALMTFCVEFQRRLTAFERPDKEPGNARVYTVDPGFIRSLGTRRWLSLGTIWGLLLYMIMWPFWWLFLKSAREGCQTLLTAAMSPECATGEGGALLKECKAAEYRNPIITDPEIGKQLWEVTEKEIELLEKAAAIERKKQEKKEKTAPKPAADATAPSSGSAGPERPSTPSTPAKTTSSSLRPTGLDTPSQRTRSRTRLA